MRKIIIHFLLFLLIQNFACINNSKDENVSEDFMNYNYESNSKLDSLKQSKSILVLKVLKVEDGIGDKFIWDKVKIISNLKNEMQIKLPSEIEIAHYSFKEGLPDDECIVYLTYFPLGSKEQKSKSKVRWILLKGNGSYGVQKI